MRYAEPISRLIKAFSKLPGIGGKTASRLALFVMNSDREYVEELSGSKKTPAVYALTGPGTQELSVS
jgi:recombination protein RecR